ncbi:hypothetical protein QJS04_geneDACA011353 [Acorus gramineus]|uniref:Uncharacterized protein n=1 Tax=Acorus gramineus TaxID=55184 RepID=A0AAV9AMN2_ACOGR|nr:hypothetical protein QJS04_geneDACA011353 [Acorus gramineus]
MQRLGQMQQQYGQAAVAAAALRHQQQQQAMYGQVNFSGTQIQQQQQQMSRPGQIGQGGGGQLPMLSGQAVQFNLQSQLLAGQVLIQRNLFLIAPLVIDVVFFGKLGLFLSIGSEVVFSLQSVELWFFFLENS